MPDLPSGTVTFLFTDIQGSTQLWEHHPDAMRCALARHDSLLTTAIQNHGGCIFKTVGDGFCVVFSSAIDALMAAVDAQRALQAESWEEHAIVQVRMALHTGDVEELNGDFLGPTVNRVSRLMSASHGGQILVSLKTY